MDQMTAETHFVTISWPRLRDLKRMFTDERLQNISAYEVIQAKAGKLPLAYYVPAGKRAEGERASAAPPR